MQAAVVMRWTLVNGILCVAVMGWMLFGHVFVVYGASQITYIPQWWDCGLLPRTEWIREWDMVAHMSVGSLTAFMALGLLPLRRCDTLVRWMCVVTVLLGLVSTVARVASTGPVTNVGYALYGCAFLRELMRSDNRTHIIAYVTWPFYYNVWYSILPVKELVAFAFVVHVAVASVYKRRYVMPLVVLAHIAWIGYFAWMKYKRVREFYYFDF